VRPRRAIAVGFREAFDDRGDPRPVIAAIRGARSAAGSSSRWRAICASRPRPRVGQPETLLGVIPGAGATQRLPRLVGPARAKEMIWTGRQIRAAEALAIGLVDRVEAPEDVVPGARQWAAEFGAGAVVAMGLAKRVIDDGLGRPLADGLDAEARAFAEVFGTEDAQIGIASFRENGPGKAKFTGR
jgi:enoyl-CoA hydratase